MKNQPKIFISYSHKDKEFVDKLSNDLREAGFNLWVDVEQLLPGTEWSKEINRVLSEIEVLLYIASRNSVDSMWMNIELGHIIENQKLVIPIIIDNYSTENLPKEIRNFQWLDLRRNYREGIKELIRTIPNEYKHKESQSPKEKISKGYVFISYSKEDDDFVQSLRDFLKKGKYGYWDFAESDRDYHSQFHLELEKVILGAHATLTILSKNWKESKWAIKEYLFSEEVSTPVFLLKAKPMPATLVIAGIPYIDFTYNPNKGFNELGKELKRKGL